MGVSDVSQDQGGETRPVELRMEDGTWEPGRLVTLSCETARALIEWKGITAWFWRQQGSGHVDEWRYVSR